MKVLAVFLGIALVASATQVTERNVQVSEDGNTIIIQKESGKEIRITKPNVLNGQHFEILVSGPDMPTKKVQISEDLSSVSKTVTLPTSYRTAQRDEEDRTKRGSRSQVEILARIFHRSQGPIDEATYEKLLVIVEQAVRRNEISPKVLVLLRNLDDVLTGKISLENDMPVDLVREWSRQGELSRLAELQRYRQLTDSDRFGGDWSRFERLPEQYKHQLPSWSERSFARDFPLYRRTEFVPQERVLSQSKVFKRDDVMGKQMHHMMMTPEHSMMMSHKMTPEMHNRMMMANPHMMTMTHPHMMTMSNDMASEHKIEEHMDMNKMMTTPSE